MNENVSELEGTKKQKRGGGGVGRFYLVYLIPLPIIDSSTKVISFLSTLQVVLSCVDGSPAARAGIHEGDELIEINGTKPSEIFQLRIRGRYTTAVASKFYALSFLKRKPLFWFIKLAFPHVLDG